MVDRLHLELRQDALEQRLVHDRAGELALHELAERRFERVHVEGDDRLAAGRGEVRDQAVADLAARPRDEDYWFANHCVSPVTAGRYTRKLAPSLRSLITVMAPPVWRMMP